jgi:hypothetical protein
MLTRHLYRYDEVRAALLWSIVSRRTTEGLFWAQELLDSGCYTELYQVLFEGWLWSVGISRMEWFRQFWILFEKTDVEEEELLHLVNGLLRLPTRDTTTLHLLFRGPTTHGIERLPPTPKTDAFLPLAAHIANSPLKEALVRCFRLGKVIPAWILAFQLFREEGEDAWWEFLSRIELVSQGSPSVRQCFEGFRGVCSSLFPEDESIRLACQATAVAFLCLSPSHQRKSIYVLAETPIDSYSASCLAEWKSMEGRRKRRVYSPPSDCLSWITSRGCNPYTKTTIKEVRSFTIDVLREKGCPFWQEALDGKNPWQDDDAFEDFWDTYFPDDIPDEWSLEDQKKSHGPGILRPTETPSIGKLVHKWFFRIPSLLIWNATKQLQPICQQDLWKEMRVWTAGYEEPYKQMQNPELQAPAKAIRFSILT